MWRRLRAPKNRAEGAIRTSFGFFFQEGDQYLSPRSRTKQEFSTFCRRAGKVDVPSNVRVDSMCFHLSTCRHAPLDWSRAAEAVGDEKRAQRKQERGACPGTSSEDTVGPMDSFLPRNYLACQLREFELYLLGVMLFS